MDSLRNPPLPFPPTQTLAQIEQGLQEYARTEHRKKYGFTKEEAISHMLSEREGGWWQ